MLVRKTKSCGYKYGTTGKVYARKADAKRQGRVIEANRKSNHNIRH